MKSKVIHSDCLESLKCMESNSIDTILSDPPYGINFMSKKWDYDVPQVEIWKECLRVLKPGGYALIFAGARTQHRMAVNIEDAGFRLMDTIMWIYGTGFPKNMNISKAVDGKLKHGKSDSLTIKQVNHERPGEATIRATTTNGHEGFVGSKTKGSTEKRDTPATIEAQQWQGYGTALKPAYEPIIMAMKPVEKTYADNAIKHGVAGLNIDECRVGLGKEGRFPANVILTHHPDCKLVGTKEIKNKSGSVSGDEPSKPAKNTYGEYERKEFKKHGENGIETIEEYVCHEDCPIRIMDEQSGIKKSGKYKGEGSKSGGIWRESTGKPAAREYGDKGGASRFFYCAKASRSERNKGLEELPKKKGGSTAKGFTKDAEKGVDRNRPTANFHPTVKPISLLIYLCNLTKTPTGGIVLDPFAGSGTTALACIETERPYIMIEREKDYIDIMKARIKDAIVNRTKSLDDFFED